MWRAHIVVKIGLKNCISRLNRNGHQQLGSWRQQPVRLTRAELGKCRSVTVTKFADRDIARPSVPSPVLSSLHVIARSPSCPARPKAKFLHSSSSSVRVLPCLLCTTRSDARLTFVVHRCRDPLVLLPPTTSRAFTSLVNLGSP